MTRTELFAGWTSEQALRGLLDRYHELGVNQPIAEVAGWIKRVFGMALPDALIAATALVHDLDLISRNHRHFERVPGLRLREAL